MRGKTVIGIVLLQLLAIVGSASAQSTQVLAGKPFTVAADHDGANTDSYCVVIDNGAPICTAKASAWTDAEKVARVTVATGVSAGAHSLVVRATGPGGSTSSDALSFTATVPPPSKPGQPHVEVTTTATVFDSKGTVVATSLLILPFPRNVK